MLVLSRKIHERIIIGLGKEIVVEIISVRQGDVRIGIIAPVKVPVHREEVYDEIYGGDE